MSDTCKELDEILKCLKKITHELSHLNVDYKYDDFFEIWAETQYINHLLKPYIPF